MKPLFVEFYTSSPTGLRAQAADAVNDALSRGSKVLVVGLDSLSSLDNAAISATIVALRRLRENGGTVRLVTRSAAHRQHLSSMGLDRIFDVFTSFEEAGERDERNHGSILSQLLADVIARVEKHKSPALKTIGE
jgi:anti-anti-sigma factor